MRRRSSGSVTSVQSSVLALECVLGDPECLLKLEGCLVDRDDISDVSLSVFDPDGIASVIWRFAEGSLDDDPGWVVL